MVFECGECGDRFWDRDDCYEHMNDYDHWFECETCSSQFLNEHSRRQHMSARDHWLPRIDCETCNMVFTSQSAANNHMRAKGHYRYYCKPCHRQFQNENNLRMHLNSKIHRGTDIKCPFCKAGFVTASGVSHHREAGSCPKAKNMNRQVIARMVQQLDTGGIIANKQLEWFGEDNSEYTVTQACYNGNGWECYLCHRAYNTSRALSQHVNSPAHAQQAYHCPNRASCKKHFVTLAALFNHLESETCSFMRFEKVQAVHQRLTDSILNNRRITMC
ncbi:hypothetical protein N7456_012407 [Penicillium angulare]|uniref:C2H2-type domain-containing protein n=1 Tax=Penicillium angulare TaxID=116970 RepID=A0A9W9EVU0_9EURO|nr:hypothetical protein N7456_012407 [Penicillium angulare]